MNAEDVGVFAARIEFIRLIVRRAHRGAFRIDHQQLPPVAHHRQCAGIPTGGNVAAHFLIVHVDHRHGIHVGQRDVQSFFIGRQRHGSRRSAGQFAGRRRPQQDRAHHAIFFRVDDRHRIAQRIGDEQPALIVRKQKRNRMRAGRNRDGQLGFRRIAGIDGINAIVALRDHVRLAAVVQHADAEREIRRAAMAFLEQVPA